MGRKNRKQKRAAQAEEKQAKEKPLAQGVQNVQSARALAAKPDISSKPSASVKPEEVVAAIVEAVAPPLFETPAEAKIEADGGAAIASAPAHAPHAHDRSFPRIALAVQIGLQSDSHFFSGLSGDVSEGGVFVQTYREIALGSEVEIDFDLPTGRVSTHGTVRWHRSPSESAPPGVGIAFENLAGEARSLIHDFCEARAPLYYDVEHA